MYCSVPKEKENEVIHLNDADFDVFNRLISMPTLILNAQKVLFVNVGFQNVFGYNVEMLNQVSLLSLINPIYVDIFETMVGRALAGDPYVDQGELCVKTTKHSIFWVEHKSRVVTYKGETHVLMHLLEINEKKRVESHLSRLLKLRESMLEVTQSIVRAEGITELYRVILRSAINSIDHASLGTVMLIEGDYLRPVAQIGFEEQGIDDFRVPFKELFLYKAVGKKLDQIAKINDLKEFGDYYRINTTSGKDDFIRSTISAPIYIKGRFFGVVNVDSTCTNAFDDDDVKLMEFVRNNVEIAISNQLLYEEKAFLSRFDSLTSLYNRHYFDEVFEIIKERAKRYNEKFNLVVFDLNDLKQTNDEYGHMAGDALLKHFAASCKSLIRKSDMLARYGGDEFVGIFFNCSQEKLRKRIDGHLKLLSDNPITYRNKPIICSYSYGIALFGDEGTTLSELFKIADDRMYENKMRYKLGFDFIGTFESQKVNPLLLE